MYCPKCGTENPDNAKFCRNCRNLLKNNKINFWIYIVIGLLILTTTATLVLIKVKNSNTCLTDKSIKSISNKNNFRNPTNKNLNSIVDSIKPINNQNEQFITYTETINKSKFEMVAVEGGLFKMGSNESPDEQPIHNVILHNFYIGKTEVTIDLWYTIMNSYPDDSKWEPNYPVAHISEKEIKQFLKKLNKITGKKYRLPTEAEWEYAAKGGKKCKNYIYSGSNNIEEVAWVDYSHPIAQKKPNELGIYDMSGNVKELCSDWYNPDYYSSSPLKNPQGPELGKSKVVRGGDYTLSTLRVCERDNYELKATERDYIEGNGEEVTTWITRYDLGFRLAFSID